MKFTLTCIILILVVLYSAVAREHLGLEFISLSTNKVLLTIFFLVNVFLLVDLKFLYGTGDSLVDTLLTAVDSSSKLTFFPIWISSFFISEEFTWKRENIDNYFLIDSTLFILDVRLDDIVTFSNFLTPSSGILF